MSLSEIGCRMAMTHSGNIAIHLAAILIAGHVAFHLKGIRRELARIAADARRLLA